ncbi:hypothetical protein N7505_007856 [Penicillium chrysogenum]|uniref:Uncharacterized protein n=1 Tax=Penicillium chrysogenum TaxID=5076 RepID=A0ABQ8WFW7_PENCH|nr:hypothetical protein N7505_007856 [Penicillium chrysogenum]
MSIEGPKSPYCDIGTLCCATSNKLISSNEDSEHTKNWSNEARGTSDTVSYDSMDGTNQEHTQARC